MDNMDDMYDNVDGDIRWFKKHHTVIVSYPNCVLIRCAICNQLLYYARRGKIEIHRWCNSKWSHSVHQLGTKILELIAACGSPYPYIHDCAKKRDDMILHFVRIKEHDNKRDLSTIIKKSVRVSTIDKLPITDLVTMYFPPV